jgi:hypothetical protein
MLVVGGVALALVPAHAARRRACLDAGAYDAEIRFRLPGHDTAGRVAGVGAVEAEANAPDQLRHVGLAQAGIGAARTRRSAVEALVDAAQEHVPIEAGRPWVARDHFSNCHVLSLRSSGARAANLGAPCQRR